jgi:transcription elongation factor
MGSELLADVYNTAGGKVNIKRIPEQLRILIGNLVKIIKGNWKGYIGTLKKVTDKNASVELSSKNKIITVDLSFIQDLKEGTASNVSNINQSIMSTPRSHSGIKTPAYYPQTPAYNNPTSPKWNPSSTRKFLNLLNIFS